MCAPHAVEIPVAIVFKSAVDGGPPVYFKKIREPNDVDPT
jgi:hypothetical protein